MPHAKSARRNTYFDQVQTKIGFCPKISDLTEKLILYSDVDVQVATSITKNRKQIYFRITIYVQRDITL